MTTTNVTDATLKGKVTGPTFTGDVDGAKFTGSVTYTDSQPIPPPDEIVIPEARITNFSNRNETSFNIDGKAFWVETPGKEWSLKQIDDRTLRFEVRSGDRFMSSYFNDPTPSER